MNLDACLELVRREARGETLTEAQQCAVDAYMCEHGECRGDVAFERELTAACCDVCADEEAPAGFVDAVMAQLPTRPVLLRAPSRWGLWAWIGGGIAAGAGSSALAWQWRYIWFGWLQILVGGTPGQENATFDWYRSLSSLQGLSAPSFVAIVLIGLGALTWGAISLAEEPS